MLLRRRPPGLDAVQVQPRPSFEHLEPGSLAVLRWLLANRVDFVVVGPVAEAIRGHTASRGPVAIVPAPYVRNYERLARALVAERAGLRSDRGLGGGPDRGGPDPIVLTADKLARGRRWMLSFGAHDLDIERAGKRAAGAQFADRDGAEGRAWKGAPRYQELLYEASRFELADGISVEVAAPEDLVHYDHVRRTGIEPEFRVARVQEPSEPAAEQSALDPGVPDAEIAEQAPPSTRSGEPPGA